MKWVLKLENGTSMQVTACFLRGIVLLDLLGSIWMALLCAAGYYAWYHAPCPLVWHYISGRRSSFRMAYVYFMSMKHHLSMHSEPEEMHITYISLWGAGCALGTLLDILAFIIPAISGLLRMELLPTVVRIGTPYTELLGALLAYHLYRDYKVSRGEPFGAYDPFGKSFEGWDPESKLFKGLTAGFKAQDAHL